MSEVRSIIETNFDKSEAYSRCLKRAQKLGLIVSEKTPGQSLRVEKKNQTPAWWAAVVFGFLFYVIPGILVLIYWKPIDYCELVFEDSDEADFKTSVLAKIKGDIGQDFYGQIGGLLSK